MCIRDRGKAPRTIYAYKTHITSFFKRFPRALRSEKDLRTSILKYFSDDIKPATFNLRRVYLKAFFDFLVRENIIEKNPIDFKKRKDEGRARAIPVSYTHLDVYKRQMKNHSFSIYLLVTILPSFSFKL